MKGMLAEKDRQIEKLKKGGGKGGKNDTAGGKPSGRGRGGKPGGRGGKNPQGKGKLSDSDKATTNWWFYHNKGSCSQGDRCKFKHKRPHSAPETTQGIANPQAAQDILSMDTKYGLEQPDQQGNETGPPSLQPTSSGEGWGEPTWTAPNHHQILNSGQATRMERSPKEG